MFIVLVNEKNFISKKRKNLTGINIKIQKLNTYDYLRISQATGNT